MGMDTKVFLEADVAVENALNGFARPEVFSTIFARNLRSKYCLICVFLFWRGSTALESRGMIGHPNARIYISNF